MRMRRTSQISPIDWWIVIFFGIVIYFMLLLLLEEFTYGLIKKFKLMLFALNYLLCRYVSLYYNPLSAEKWLILDWLYRDGELHKEVRGAPRSNFYAKYTSHSALKGLKFFFSFHGIWKFFECLEGWILEDDFLFSLYFLFKIVVFIRYKFLCLEASETSQNCVKKLFYHKRKTL